MAVFKFCVAGRWGPEVARRGAVRSRGRARGGFPLWSWPWVVGVGLVLGGGGVRTWGGARSDTSVRRSAAAVRPSPPLVPALAVVGAAGDLLFARAAYLAPRPVAFLIAQLIIEFRPYRTN